MGGWVVGARVWVCGGGGMVGSGWERGRGVKRLMVDGWDGMDRGGMG